MKGPLLNPFHGVVSTKKTITYTYIAHSDPSQQTLTTHQNADAMNTPELNIVFGQEPELNIDNTGKSGNVPESTPQFLHLSSQHAHKTIEIIIMEVIVGLLKGEVALGGVLAVQAWSLDKNGTTDSSVRSLSNSPLFDFHFARSLVVLLKHITSSYSDG